MQIIRELEANLVQNFAFLSEFRQKINLQVHILSTIVAMPMPPPTHSVAMP